MHKCNTTEDNKCEWARVEPEAATEDCSINTWGTSVCLAPPNLGSFCVEFACSPCFCMIFLKVVQLSPTVQIHADWGSIHLRL